MTEIGDGVLLEGMRLIRDEGGGASWPGGQYRPLLRVGGATVEARDWLLGAVAHRSALRLELPLPAPVDALGMLVAWQLRLPDPVGVLVHRDVPLSAHRDTQNPVPCTNATVFFREATEGGWLVLAEDEIAVDGTDGWVAVFDGQRIHGITTSERTGKDGFRMSATYYCPR